MLRPTPILLFLVALGALSVLMEGTPRVHADFDGGSLESATVEGDTITLLPRTQSFGRFVHERYWWVCFEVEGAAGSTPQFRLPLDRAHFGTHGRTHRYVYSEDGGLTWQPFPRHEIEGGILRFGGARFRSDHVRVAYSPAYPVERVSALVEVLARHPHVLPTASASKDFLLGETAAEVLADGRHVPALPLYGMRITDPEATEPKAKVVLVGGNHSGEHAGSHLLEHLLVTLLADTDEARELRRTAEFYVYPMVDPAGRYAGYWRSNAGAAHLDHNRHWDNPAPFPALARVLKAIRTDTGGQAEVFLDVHNYGANERHALFLARSSAANSLVQLLRGEAGATLRLHETPPPPGSSRQWAADVLQARVAVTPEAAVLADPAGYATLARAYRAALAGALTGEPSGSVLAGATTGAPSAERTGVEEE